MAPQPTPVPIIESKLYIPRWPVGLVARPGLVECIAGARGRLTLIAAPAGSGKTTLLAEWIALRGSDDPRVAWVSLDDTDNEPAFFWTCVVRALQSICPVVGPDDLLTADGGTAPTVAALTLLLNEITSLDCDVVLVLDDYHVIEASAIHTALSFVLDHLPPRMHIVIATRADPPLPLARMRARGELVELRAGELRFTQHETAAFFSSVMALDLATADVAVLERRTEGWIAGLKLAALSMQGSADITGFIRAFSGDNRYVADYLIEEVLQSQPERIRRFLLDTSILERLNAEVCDALTRETGSQAVLESLEKRNMFVVALDDRREWFRYHHLFADVLQAYAAREDAGRLRELHRRASAWYEQQGAFPEAVRHAEHSGDMERMADLLAGNWSVNNRSHESRRWLERVKSLPAAAVATRPALNMGYAWALLNAGELEAAEVRLAGVEAALEPERHDELAREAATARVYLAQARGDGAATAEHARRALDMVPAGDHAAVATASALLALAQWAQGDLNAAHDTFAAALGSMRSADMHLDAIRGEFVLGDIRSTQGRLSDAARIYEGGIALAAPYAGAETDELYLGLSEIMRERGQLQEARRLLQVVDEQSSRTAYTGNRHRWCTVMSRVVEAEGDLDSALVLLTEAETALRRDPLPVVRPVAAMKARIRIAQGDIPAAEHWAKEQALRSEHALSFLRAYDHITLARLHLARNELDEAVMLLQRLATAARESGRLPLVLEALALEALGQQRLGHMSAAMDAIGAALELAEPEGYMRVFVDEGMAMRDLLRLATARGIAGGWTRRVLAGFEDAPEPLQLSPDNAQLLTAREHEVLRLIAAGLRNQEIASQLFISPATVKRHIANVYNKLEASHRTDALRRAATLNLL
jgi:LuxR family transcriptional regulator, maltose regulon positive regulatory protein